MGLFYFLENNHIIFPGNSTLCLIDMGTRALFRSIVLAGSLGPLCSMAQHANSSGCKRSSDLVEKRWKGYTFSIKSCKFSGFKAFSLFSAQDYQFLGQLHAPLITSLL